MPRLCWCYLAPSLFLLLLGFLGLLHFYAFSRAQEGRSGGLVHNVDELTKRMLRWAANLKEWRCLKGILLY